MDSNQIRKAYLDFFSERQHAVIERASLILVEDPTTLFTGSGMQPLLPYLLGEDHPEGNRLVDSQTCLRSQDIDEVGDNRHTTFFEMMGNWSLGDYFKEDQIRWFFEFLVDVVGLEPSRIYVTCFIGDSENNIDKDTASAEIWQKLFQEKGVDNKVVEIGSAENGDKVGMQGGRIFYYDDGENWWSRGGGIAKTPIGDPCGPDSEVFYDFGDDFHDESEWGKAHPANDSGRFMEIGNQVFMQYKRTKDGFEKLPAQNVDFGGGLERISAAQLNEADVFKISILWPIIEALQNASGKKYEDHVESMRVIADHMRAATFLAVDGMIPSNNAHGYVMRKLIRRAVRFAFDLGLTFNVAEKVVPVIADIYENDFPEVKEKRDKVIATIVKEEKIFRQTLTKGVRQFDKFSENGLTGEEVFKLYDTFGFPVELSVEEAEKRNIKIADDWEEEFDKLMQQQKDRSRTASKGEFKGGLGGDTEVFKRYHTATHLMYKALRIVLGEHVEQRGSNITEERTRFDFSHDGKMTDEEKQEVERIVNEVIDQKLPVTFKEFPTQEALDRGARGHFGEKYGEMSKVYFMGPEDKPFSMELCGGPHVDNTEELGAGGVRFKIMKEQSSSSGVRRIKATLS